MFDQTSLKKHISNLRRISSSQTHINTSCYISINQILLIMKLIETVNAKVKYNYQILNTL